MKLPAVLLMFFCNTVVALPSSPEAPLPIGAEDDWAPFSSAPGGKPTGMAVDIVSAIFAEAGIAIELRPVPYKRCMAETEKGLLAGCFDTTPSEELRRNFIFHRKPLFSDPTFIVAKSNSTARALSVKDLEGKRVAITNGYTYGDEFESIPGITKEVVQRDINGLRMLDIGRVDYALIFRTVLANLLKGEAGALNGNFKVVGTLRNDDLYLTFSKRYPGIERVAERFNAAHARLIANGTIHRIVTKWQ